MDEMTRAPQIFLPGAHCRAGIWGDWPGGARAEMWRTAPSNPVRATAPVSSTLM